MRRNISQRKGKAWSRATVRGWYLVHKWTSLVCTAFLLLLCVTGLPLIFHDEIDRALAVPGAARPAGPPSSGTAAGLKPLDAILAGALAHRPGEVPLFMAFSNDDPLVTVTTGPIPAAPPARMTMQLIDRASGRPAGQGETGITAWLLRLHTDLFVGLPGELLLGVMGLLFAAALVSGAILYAPFTRKLAFGTVRARRSTRVRWLDQHNLLGIVTLAWALVVGVTGAINAFQKPLAAIWQANELAAMTHAQGSAAPLPPARYTSLDRAMTAARAAVPGARPQFVAFPGTGFSSARHYAIFFQGGTPLTERLLTPALVDAGTGRLTDRRPMPWYMAALAFAQPLHFGDYGGLAMKLVWAALDLVTIAVLGSGLYLWIDRRGTPLDARVREVETGGRVAPPLPA